MVILSATTQYGTPKTSKKVIEATRLSIPQQTQDQNKWVGNLWYDWVQYRLRMPCVKKEEK